MMAYSLSFSINCSLFLTSIGLLIDASFLEKFNLKALERKIIPQWVSEVQFQLSLKLVDIE